MTKETPIPAKAARAAPTANVPAKFRDPATGEIRVQPLLDSYLELERRFGAARGDGIPGSPEDYQIETVSEFLASDPEVNTRLHQAGFTRSQVQLVYSLAEEKILPAVVDLVADQFAQTQLQRLIERFGGEDKWAEVSRQLAIWGQSNLPQSTFAELSTTYEGVLALFNMMNGGEPGLVTEGGRHQGALNEDDLRKMMDDPRYWRDHDESYVAKVTDGFKRLYPD
ncbi:hypothetical protein [Magnetospira sp. QH-2]|uniref:capsid assembly protein n=1 Tax=Magnetospira sp. (strain QH-2) TaxID=1288970 RepID=UPI0003E80F9F|nr:hypothetical protein [Magnetospira sp. QH-2]CCQ72344.1 conserved protein of unknown function [Magnetospira sp. QH-2]